MKLSREEQVWRMARDLCALNQRCEECNVYPDCKAKLYAERAIDKGYSKTSEVTKEQETCTYCHEDREGYVSANGAFFLSLDRHEGWLLHAGKSKCKPRPVKYCPMCGRKLLTFKEEVLQK